MKVLVLNAGSSSLKFQLRDSDTGVVLADGVVAKIGEAESYLSMKSKGLESTMAVNVRSHAEALRLAMESLLDPQRGAIGSTSEIDAVGHRTVHGGEFFSESTLVTDDVVRRIEACVPLAPLHNPANLLCIQESRRLLPGVPHVAVFDTAFHQSLPERAFLYAIPYDYYTSHRIRRYGFHGISCRYVSQRAAEMLGRPLEELKLVVCHLGNGVTLAAVDGGRSIDTSMGMTPLEGMMMGTRSGDIDPGILFFLSREFGVSMGEIEDLLNRKSGLLGVSGVSNDMREIFKGAAEGNLRCRLAIDMYVYRVAKTVGAYAVALGGLDALVFTAGVGEGSPEIRALICGRLGVLGLKLDEVANSAVVGAEGRIGAGESRVQILVIPSSEESVIAADTVKLVRGLA